MDTRRIVVVDVPGDVADFLAGHPAPSAVVAAAVKAWMRTPQPGNQAPAAGYRLTARDRAAARRRVDASRAQIIGRIPAR